MDEAVVALVDQRLCSACPHLLGSGMLLSSRSTDFRQCFEVCADEMLLGDFPCALSS